MAQITEFHKLSVRIATMLVPANVPNIKEH